MKIDLVGERDRGFAMGLNEFAGYFAVGIFAFLSGYLAQKFGIRPYPFLLGEVIVVLGLLLSVFLVKDTRKHVEEESQTNSDTKLRGVFWETSFRNKTLSSITQAGLVNNLNDGMIWGLLPVLLVSLHYELDQIGLIVCLLYTSDAADE